MITGLATLWAATVPLFVVTDLYDFSELPKAHLIQWGALILGAVVLVQARLSTQSRWPITPGVCLCVWCVIWSGMTLLWSTAPHFGASRWLHWAACAGWFLVLRSTPLNDRHRKLILVGVFCGAVLTAIIGLAQVWFGLKHIPQPSPPAATFANKNFAAHYLALALPAACAVFVTQTRPWRLLLIAFGTTAVLVFLILTLTKGAWLAVIAQLVGASIWAMRYRKTWQPHLSGKHVRLAGVIFLLAYLVCHITAKGWQWREAELIRYVAAMVAPSAPTPTSLDAKSRRSVTARTTWWYNTWQLIKQRPLLGIGTDNFRFHYASSLIAGRPDPHFSLLAQVKRPHNDYLQVTCELGFVFVLVTGTIVFRLITRQRQHDSRSSVNVDVINLAVLLACVSYGTSALMSFPTYQATPPFLLALYLGVYRGSPTNMPNSAGKAPSVTGRVGSAIAVLLWLLAVAIVPSRQFHHFRADLHNRPMQTAYRDRNWQEVIQHATPLLNHTPYSIPAHTMIGWASFHLRDFEKAKAHMAIVQAVWPDAPQHLYHTARLHETTGDLASALKAIDRALLILPREAVLYDIRGRIYSRLDRPSEAIVQFQRATELAPEYPSYWQNLGAQAHQNQDHPLAINAFINLIRLSPKSYLAHKTAGLLILKHGADKDRGLKLLRQAIELDPQAATRDALPRTLERYQAAATRNPAAADPNE